MRRGVLQDRVHRLSRAVKASISALATFALAVAMVFLKSAIRRPVGAACRPPGRRVHGQPEGLQRPDDDLLLCLSSGNCLPCERDCGFLGDLDVDQNSLAGRSHDGRRLGPLGLGGNPAEHCCIKG